MNSLSLEQKKSAINAVLDAKIKPLGALGQLESLAAKLALLQSTEVVVEKIEINRPTLLLFAADHGIAQHGVSIAPSDVTTLMVNQFLSGGAAINSFVNIHNIDLHVIDAGMKTPIPKEYRDVENYFDQRIANGTQDFTQTSAMTEAQLKLSLTYGEKAFDRAIEQGSNFILLGEMGIGNTTSASAILAALTEIPVADAVGRGTGVTDEQVLLKERLIGQALSQFQARDGLSVLKHVGGFEIAQMVGVILAAEKANTPVVIDGFIVTSAALIASKISPSCLDVLIFAHCSDEKAHQYMLAQLSVEPLLSLGLRLGEGTGAALAVPMIRVAADIYNNMKTFADLGIELP